jgi:hypothetical protein
MILEKHKYYYYDSEVGLHSTHFKTLEEIKDYINDLNGPNDLKGVINRNGKHVLEYIYTAKSKSIEWIIPEEMRLNFYNPHFYSFIQNLLNKKK